MAMITIRNIDDSLKSRLRIAAAQHGCSMEEEARRILREALVSPAAGTSLGTRLHQRMLEVSGGAELPPTARTQPRAAPTFADDEP
ncbi:plasmid stabilization protein [uncultured Thiodictyon sp.]|uniref:FitA-like ribbon-helix-helix domain-containing protein n=1 Tax=uncultured Thiodictyon sp. TaxID=1846217 RepID=UPI0025F5E55C|nr:plasmid stabilization protein [uncultured Thiodictyon sp.]